MFRELLNLLRPSPDIPTDERRDTMRLRCKVGAILKVGQDLHFVHLVNVTLTGLCMDVEIPVKPAQRLELTRDDFGEPLQCEVIWCKKRRGGNGYRAGLRYAADQAALTSSFLRPALRQAGFHAEFPGEKRQLIRVPGRVACQLKGLTGEKYTDAEMLDLSLGGALVESGMPFNEGLTVAFETLPMGGLPPLRGIAKIASVQQQDALDGKWHCGLRFTDSVPEDVRKYMKSMLASA